MEKKNTIKPIKASMWFFVSSIIQKGIQFFTIPILVRLMTQEQYGEYTVFWGWYYIIRVFTSLQLYNYVMQNGMIKYPDDKYAFRKSLLGVSLFCTTLVSLLLLIFYKYINTIFGIKYSLLVLMIVDLVFMPAYELWCTFQRFDYKYKWVVISSITISILTPVLSIYLVLNCDDKSSAAIFSKVLISTLIYIVPFVLIIKDPSSLFNKTYWKYAFTMAIPLIPHQLSFQILEQSDRLMIDYYVGKDKAGVYGFSYNLAKVVLIINEAVMMSFNPWLYKNLKDRNFKLIHEASTVLLIFIAYVLICFEFCIPEIIVLLGTKKYEAGVAILQPITTSMFFMFLFSLFVGIEYYYESVKGVSISTVIAAIVNFVLNFVLIPRVGYVVAAYTTLISYCLMVLCHYFFARIALSKNDVKEPVYNIKLIIILILLFAVTMIFLNSKLATVMSRYFLIILFSSAFLFYIKNKIQYVMMLIKK